MLYHWIVGTLYTTYKNEKHFIANMLDYVHVCEDKDNLRLFGHLVIWLMCRGRFGGGVPLRGWNCFQNCIKFR